MTDIDYGFRPLNRYLEGLFEKKRPAYVELDERLESSSAFDLIRKLSNPLSCASKDARRRDASSRCLIFIDCGMFETLVTEFDLDGRSLLEPQRALLYIVRAGEFLELSGEAYVRNVNELFALPNGVNVTYACFRSLESLAHRWEFCAGFYIWDSSDH